MLHNITVWAGGGPMPDELKHAARILTVKEWIRKKKIPHFIVVSGSTYQAKTVNRPYK